MGNKFGKLLTWGQAQFEIKPEKCYKYGEEGSETQCQNTAGPQDFKKLRKSHYKKTLFEDPEFSCVDNEDIKWMRPKEINKNAQFFVDGCSRFDVNQSEELANCWLIVAIANLTLHQGIFAKVVPQKQSFDKKYAGIFHFLFWYFGRWIDIVIDDRLPTSNGKLIHLRPNSDNPNEFWAPLLEKAYVKLHGSSYEALAGGYISEAFEDFTGGLTYIYDLNNAPDNFHQLILEAQKSKSMMACTIMPTPDEREDGLIEAHAYSVTNVKEVTLNAPSEQVLLIRLRNPWGKTEWNGAWSDSSCEWNRVSKRDQMRKKRDDGEFWMSYKDFKNKFDWFDLCYMNPQSNDKKLKLSYYRSSWKKDFSAGGYNNKQGTFASNPQFRITLEKTNDKESDGKCTVIVALTQMIKRTIESPPDFFCIGITLYKIDPLTAPNPLDEGFIGSHEEVEIDASRRAYQRQVCYHLTLEPGTYCIIPSTLHPKEECEFLLRLFSEDTRTMSKHDALIAEITLKTPNKGDVPFYIDENIKKHVNLIREEKEITWLNLQKLLEILLLSLKVDEEENFDEDDYETMIRMYNNDVSDVIPTLNIEEFDKLWQDIMTWTKAFFTHDRDKSNSISGMELREVLKSAGFMVNDHVLEHIMRRHGNDGNLTFVNFIASIAKLKKSIETYKQREIEVSLNDWLDPLLDIIYQ